ncbi:MAG: YicC/YloC family endoribonuclease [Planctomycetota bacterium]
MIRSMTGFGDAATHEGGIHYFVEVRSLNGKYFKCSSRLPEQLMALEPIIESTLRRRLVRGTITATCKYSDSSGTAAYTINSQAIERYMSQLRDVPGVMDGGATFDVTSLMGLPGVLLPPSDDEAFFDRVRPIFEKLIDEACDHLVSMRVREGALLVEDLLSHEKVIEERLGRLREHAPRVVEDYETRLRTRIETLLENAGVQNEPVDLIREVAAYAERSDIAEELARLSGHMGQFRSLLTSNDDRPVGRTLDFLAQEMLREANTIASKSGDAQISRDIVEVKGAIDRIKEQVQNVE